MPSVAAAQSISQADALLNRIVDGELSFPVLNLPTETEKALNPLSDVLKSKAINFLENTHAAPGSWNEKSLEKENIFSLSKILKIALNQSTHKTSSQENLKLSASIFIKKLENSDNPVLYGECKIEGEEYEFIIAWEDLHGAARAQHSQSNSATNQRSTKVPLKQGSPLSSKSSKSQNLRSQNVPSVAREPLNELPTNSDGSSAGPAFTRDKIKDSSSEVINQSRMLSVPRTTTNNFNNPLVTDLNNQGNDTISDQTPTPAKRIGLRTFILSKFIKKFRDETSPTPKSLPVSAPNSTDPPRASSVEMQPLDSPIATDNSGKKSPVATDAFKEKLRRCQAASDQAYKAREKRRSAAHESINNAAGL